jgi:Protein of unknown function (DUF3040)
MALSMDEQRILDEMERKLANDDPLLASRLTSFGRPGLAALIRSRRARIVLSFLALVVIAAVSLAVYALTPFRTSFGVTGRSAATHNVTKPAAPASSHNSSGTAQP